MGEPRVLILGHSFIKRLRRFVLDNSPDYGLDFNLSDSVNIFWHGVGGRTIAKVQQHDLAEIIRIRPHIVYLEIGTNDLSQRGMSPLTVGSAIEEFVRLIHDNYGVSIVCVGQTVRRSPVGNFNENVKLLAHYLKAVLEPLPFAVYWSHRGFWRPSLTYLSYDGLHLNKEGQHKLFKSIRGAIIHCLNRLKH